jgi:hypothetical protein
MPTACDDVAPLVGIYIHAVMNSQALPRHALESHVSVSTLQHGFGQLVN